MIDPSPGPERSQPSPPEDIRPPTAAADSPWDAPLLRRSIEELRVIRGDLLELERRFVDTFRESHPAFRRSARNLVHYLALRRHDIRTLQERLASLGLSSLGRTESHVLAAIDSVLRVLAHMACTGLAEPASAEPAISLREGNALLSAHTEALLGPRPSHRGVRIMVTMPGEAAEDYDLVRQLVAHGIDCVRINCAHDDAETWAGMVSNLHRARRELAMPCRVLMDLAGPKLRTGVIDARSQILKWSPRRDERGQVEAAARIWITPLEAAEPAPGPADGILRVPSDWLRARSDGETIRFTDLRGKSRVLELEAPAAAGAWASARQTAYLEEGRALSLACVRNVGRPGGKAPIEGVVDSPHPDRHFIQLEAGDTLVLTSAPVPGRPAVRDDRGRILRPASISCSLPEIFADVKANERIWFDDGKIGGTVESVGEGEIRVRITMAGNGGEKLRADKGINLPDSSLRTPALTDKDIDDLAFVVRHADLVGMSFVRKASDLHELQAQLVRLGAPDLGIVLKIETTSAFENLPKLLLSAMRNERIGVMIARGDLAVECGYERLAEIQEEILWFCEAAHVPVIWATQVLETLAKTGMPSRAEITDAAMGERAECVMLNKGPHLVDAVRVLQDILKRMEAHQSKKSARLRRLRLSAIAAGS